MATADPITETDRLVLAIPPAPEFIGMARLFAAAVARHFGCDEEAVDDIKIAVSEAVTNSVKAHRDAGVADPVRVFGVVEIDALHFEIVDRGPGVDPDVARAAATITPPQGLFEGSLGLTVIESLFPNTEMVRNEDRGMTVRFAISLP